MLILSRRVGESVMMGNDVTVTVPGMRGNKIWIGIEAPLSIAVHRKEYFERIERERNAPSGWHSNNTHNRAIAG